MKRVIAALLGVLLCAAVLIECANFEAFEDNRPTDDYDWDYITSLLRADEVSSAEVDELARLYSAMTPKDMERFLAAGYVHPRREGWDNRELPSYVLGPVMAQLCRQFVVQTDNLTLTLFNDEGVPQPDVTPQQVEAAQLQMLRAGIMQDVCAYGQEVYFSGAIGYTEGIGPVAITQFGVNEELDGLYIYNITLRRYVPYDTVHDNAHEWASRGMGTGMITVRQAKEIWREKHFEFLNELEKTLPFFRQSMHNKLRARGNEDAFSLIRGLQALGAFVRMGYNTTTMQMEIRYVTYNESEAYLRYTAYVNQLQPGEYRPDFKEFVETLQSGVVAGEEDQNSLFTKITSWYQSDPTSAVNDVRDAYAEALEQAKVAQPDIEWPATLDDCTKEQMIDLLFYM